MHFSRHFWAICEVYDVYLVCDNLEQDLYRVLLLLKSCWQGYLFKEIAKVTNTVQTFSQTF